MASAKPRTESAYQRHAWIVLLVLGILHTVSGLFVLLAGVDTGEFQNTTGVAWAEWSAANPTVAPYLRFMVRLMGAGFFGFALLGTAIALWPFRRGERWAWYLLWSYPVVLGLTAGILYFQKVAGLGSFHAGSAILAVVGLLLPLRMFFSQSVEANGGEAGQ